MLVPGLNDDSANVFTTSFSPDELTAYFGMFHGDQVDIYTSSRTSRTEAFGLASRVPSVNSLFTDFSPSVTADALTLYMNSTRSGAFALYVSSRPSTSMEFSVPIELTELDVYGEGNPSVTPDGTALYFHSYRTGSFDLFRARKLANGFEAPQPVAINTQYDEALPTPSADERTLYFLSLNNPAGPDGIWMATRASVDQPFSGARPLDELTGQTAAPVQPLWISPDECRLYFQDRDAQNGYLVYVAERIR